MRSKFQLAFAIVLAGFFLFPLIYPLLMFILPFSLFLFSPPSPISFVFLLFSQHGY